MFILEVRRIMKGGIKQGIEQGKEEEKDAIVKSLLDHEMSIDFISEITGLSTSRVAEVKKDYTK